ncbi:MAG: glycosyltransferase family 39 protein [Chloroflexi bacterium]|uniref:hypothetical protein n=1 Tax=Candidatus Flexifilum breve TaxID=3140694 RepID=UPI003134EE8F|nr:glycosyltransferase family 39 protein [Chloroflexota bacterium]
MAKISEARHIVTGYFNDSRVIRTLLVVISITLCATVARLLTFDRYFPFVDYSDEVVYIALADEVRGFSNQAPLREQYGSLAPLYVSTNVIVHSIHDALKSHLWHIPGEYLYSMHLLSVLFGVCTALTMTWIGWQLSGSLAAILSGLVWALSPVVVEFNSLALPDPMLYLACALSVASAIAAWQRKSLRFLMISLGCGIAAIYLKLWIVTAIVPFIMTSLALIVRNRQKFLLRITLLYGSAILFAIHFIIVVNPLQNTNKISDNLSSGSFLANLFDVSRLLNNLWHIAYTIDGGMGLSFVILALGITAYLYSRYKRLIIPDTGSLWIVGTYIIATWWLSAGISRVDLGTAGRMRHIFPIVVAFVPFWCVYLEQIVVAGRQLLRRNLGQTSLIRWAVAASGQCLGDRVCAGQLADY